MKRKIITNLKELRRPSEIVTDFAESLDIIKDLEDSLDTTKGIGLSAVQIGIYKQVGIIRTANKKIDLINPVLVDKYNKFCMKQEGCLSLPGLRIDTLRYQEITIQNNNKEYVFDVSMDGVICIAIQHELEHMRGKVILDSKWRKR